MQYLKAILAFVNQLELEELKQLGQGNAR